jgi:subtilisin family serine protease
VGLTLLAAAALTSVKKVRASEWQASVDPWVLKTAAKEGQTELLVFLKDQADLSQAASLKTKPEKGTYVYNELREVADRSQPAVLSALKAFDVEYQSFWIANMIWVKGDLEVVERMARRSDVSHIYANPEVPFEAPVDQDDGQRSPETVEWNILQVNAHIAWQNGYTGTGAVIGGQDTGYDWDHPALKNQYRGWDGGSADHNYSWHDAIHTGGGSCGADSPEPCDDYGHGTHTMGIMVGDDGAGNQIGMAPGARWIGCRNMDVGVGTPATYSECYQWFVAPTDLNDENEDPSMAPDVINNSWSCPASEGCTEPDILLAIVENVRAAGILTVHSAGNLSSAGCSSISEPAAIYDSSYTVGALDNVDNIANFSRRGPVAVDGSGRLKPDISAPGVGVRSSVPGTGYGIKSGTSMSAPHVAGLAALLISAKPSLAGNVDGIESWINRSALPLVSSTDCGGIPGGAVPNNTFGYGRIDAGRLIRLLSPVYAPYITHNN